MRDYAEEFENRVRFIREILSKSGAEGIVFGNSGGKDSALVGILCKAACDNTVGVILPCSTIRNYDEDMRSWMRIFEANRLKKRRKTELNRCMLPANIRDVE